MGQPAGMVQPFFKGAEFASKRFPAQTPPTRQRRATGRPGRFAGTREDPMGQPGGGHFVR